jgi:uncharacterized protein YjbJ (UPF0337 family)
MINDEFPGKWKLMRAKAKGYWAKLSDEDLKKVGGDYKILIGLLQEKYGLTPLQAEQEYRKRVK